MLTRYEYLYTKKKAKDLSGKLFEFENGRVWDSKSKQFIEDTTYKRYQLYLRLSEFEKKQLQEEWDKYYLECAKSPYGLLFWEMKPLYLANDMKGVKEMAIKSKELKDVPVVKKPSSIDPNELIMKMNSYLTLRYELKILTDLVEEYAEIYEKKDEKSSL